MVVWVGFPFSQVVDKAALSSWFPHTLFGVSFVIHRSITERTPKEQRRNSLFGAAEKATWCGLGHATDERIFPASILRDAFVMRS